MLWLLQVSVSVIFFANKLFVLMGKKTGWLLGVVAAILAVFYFYLIGLYVYMVLDFGLVVLMGYGFIKKSDRNPRMEMLIRLVVVVIMFLEAAFAFHGLMTIVELGSSLGLLAGTYLLAQGQIRAGWAIQGIGHILGAILGYGKGQQFFADFQIASLIVAILGVIED